MSSAFKNITVVGAAGNLGKAVFQKLVDSAKFNIQVLRRHGSTSQYPAGTKVVDIDLASVEALTAALKGQDVVVALLGAPALGLQLGLIEASINAGVRRFIPSEFGSDISQPKNRNLLPFIEKVKVEDYLIEKAKTSSLSYSFVFTGAFLDWGLEHNFILDTSGYQPTLFDGGDVEFSTTSLDTIAEAAVAILTHPSETENQAIYLEDFKTTQNELLSVAKRVAPNKPWQPKHSTVDDAVAVADKRLADGIIDYQTVAPYLYRALFDPSHNPTFQKNHLELLGVKAKDKKFVDEVFTEILK